LFFNGKITKGKFIGRQNRFVVEVRIGNRRVKAHLPNPGRLMELLLPGATLILEEKKSPGATLPYGVIGVYRDGVPIMLHTSMANDVVAHLIDAGKIPGLEGFEVVAREVRLGRSRIDFLLKNRRESMLLEVKSCTLFGGEVAMFPDAVTKRGKHHLEKLAHENSRRSRTGVLFLVQWERAKYFLPDYHTDIEFSLTFHELRKKLTYLPVSVSWNEDLTLGGEVRALEIPWKVLEREMTDAGAYLIILRLEKTERISVGSLGKLEFPRGHYLYTGSAKKNLKSRLARHYRRRKNLRWHVDYLREKAEITAVLPIRTSLDIECSLARDLKNQSDGEIEGFGSSDCNCKSHLFYFERNPLELPEFHRIVQWYRMELPVRTFS